MSIKQLMIAILISLIAIAHYPKPSDAEPGESVATLVKQLGDDNFSVREKAQEDLLNMGPPVLKSLLEIRKDQQITDPEILRRLDRVTQVLHDKQSPLVIKGELTKEHLALLADRINSFDRRFQLLEDPGETDRNYLRDKFSEIVYMTLGSEYEATLAELYKKKDGQQVIEGRIQKLRKNGVTDIGYVPVVKIKGTLIGTGAGNGKVFLIEAESLTVYYRNRDPKEEPDLPQTTILTMSLICALLLLQRKRAPSFS